jgi:xylulokinase
MNGLIAVDRIGDVLFNDIIHSDSRSYVEAEKILEIFSPIEYYNITGVRMDPHYTLSKILWIKNNYHDIYKNTAYFLNSKDYITYKLTGNLGNTDLSDASLTGALDIREKCWSNALVKGLGIDMDKFPKILASYNIIGSVNTESAKLLGLIEGIPVVAGGGDGACATKGAGVCEKGKAYNYIGSSSWISALNETPIFDIDAKIFNFYDLDGDNCNVCGTVQCATISYDWVIENMGKYEFEEAIRKGLNVFDFIDGIAEQSPAGSNGVFFLPYLMGERTPIWDKNAKGAFIGLSLYNKKSDLFRAVYEGIGYALRSVLDVFEDNGLNVEQLTLIGGGAKSRFLNEIMCNVYQKQLLIHEYPREATSLGAAIAAGVGVGIFKDFKEACSIVKYCETINPEKVLGEKYFDFYETYKMMYPNLKPIYDKLAKQEMKLTS